MGPVKRLDTGSLVVMGITLVLFVGAIFAKGMTHDLLLEAGVFLISVKLILMAYKNSVTAEAHQKSLEEIKALLLALRRDDAGTSGREDAGE